MLFREPIAKRKQMLTTLVPCHSIRPFESLSRAIGSLHET
jgi:hypothetical protein